MGVDSRSTPFIIHFFKLMMRSATGRKEKKKNRAYSSLHFKSEQSCVTEMKKEEDAPFLSLAAGGAPRFIQML